MRTDETTAWCQSLVARLWLAFLTMSAPAASGRGFCLLAHRPQGDLVRINVADLPMGGDRHAARTNGAGSPGRRDDPRRDRVVEARAQRRSQDLLGPHLGHRGECPAFQRAAILDALACSRSKYARVSGRFHRRHLGRGSAPDGVAWRWPAQSRIRFRRQKARGPEPQSDERPGRRRFPDAALDTVSRRHRPSHRTHGRGRVDVRKPEGIRRASQIHAGASPTYGSRPVPGRGRQVRALFDAAAIRGDGEKRIRSRGVRRAHGTCVRCDGFPELRALHRRAASGGPPGGTPPLSCPNPIRTRSRGSAGDGRKRSSGWMPCPRPALRQPAPAKARPIRPASSWRSRFPGADARASQSQAEAAQVRRRRAPF